MISIKKNLLNILIIMTVLFILTVFIKKTVFKINKIENNMDAYNLQKNCKPNKIKNNANVNNLQKTRKPVVGICAFDVDGCCLEGQKNTCYYNGKRYDETNGGCTAAAIQACRDKGYIIAVNTASNRKREDFYKRIGMVDENGNCVVEEKNWWNNLKYHALESKQGSNHGGCGKAYIMKILCELNGIKDRSKAILWDDYYKNIIAAQSAGFGVIPMSNVTQDKFKMGDGIHQNQIDRFLSGDFTFNDMDPTDYIKCVF